MVYHYSQKAVINWLPKTKMEKMVFPLAKFSCQAIKKLKLCKNYVGHSFIHSLFASLSLLSFHKNKWNFILVFYKFENHYLIKDAIMPPPALPPQKNLK